MTQLRVIRCRWWRCRIFWRDRVCRGQSDGGGPVVRGNRASCSQKSESLAADVAMSRTPAFDLRELVKRYPQWRTGAAGVRFTVGSREIPSPGLPHMAWS